VTAADPCNPSVTLASLSGPCRDPLTMAPTGVPNPDHRDIIDSPGHRFSIDDTTTVDLWVMGVVMF
jgi:hypothetical protein